MSKCWLLVVLFALVVGCEQGSASGPAVTALSAQTQGVGGADSRPAATSQPAADKGGEKPVEQASAEQVAKGKELFVKKCQLCHMPLDADGKRLGPSLETSLRTLPKELTDEAYGQRITALKTLNRKYYDYKKGAIEPILAETDADRRLQLWLRTYLKDTKFDDPKNKMATLPGLSDSTIDAIVAYVLSQRKAR